MSCLCSQLYNCRPIDTVHCVELWIDWLKKFMPQNQQKNDMVHGKRPRTAHRPTIMGNVYYVLALVLRHKDLFGTHRTTRQITGLLQTSGHRIIHKDLQFCSVRRPLYSLNTPMAHSATIYRMSFKNVIIKPVDPLKKRVVEESLLSRNCSSSNQRMERSPYSWSLN